MPSFLYSLRRTLVGTVDGVVVVEQQSLGVGTVFHFVADGDGAREHYIVAVGVLRGVDEVVGGEGFVRVVGRVGDVSFGNQIGVEATAVGVVVFGASDNGQDGGKQHIGADLLKSGHGMLFC